MLDGCCFDKVLYLFKLIGTPALPLLLCLIFLSILFIFFVIFNMRNLLLPQRLGILIGISILTSYCEVGSVIAHNHRGKGQRFMGIYGRRFDEILR